MYENISVNSNKWFDLNTLINEIWEDIPDFEGIYKISNYGRVKSLSRYVNHFNGYKLCKKYVCEKILKCAYDKDGYPIVSLCKDGKSYWRRVHQLMGYIFLGNDGSKIVNHVDLNKQNPRLDNLELCTDYDNRQHAKINGAVRKGRKLLLFNNDTNILYDDIRDFANKNNLSYGMSRYYIYKVKEWNGYKFSFVQ